MKHFEKNLSLREYVDQLQARGYYTFHKSDAQSVMKVSDAAFMLAANRLAKKKRIASPRRGFFVVVPTEYQLSGAPPATWFIDELMKFHGIPYYIGLLSAASLHGAAHQQPQEFQVITSNPLRPIHIGREKVKFFTKKQIANTATEKIKGVTGFFPISTPESTALDLIRYCSSVGYLNHVATILNELKEKISPKQLLKTIKVDGKVASAQRLGYLLDLVDGENLTHALHKWVTRQNPLYAPLVPTRKLAGDPKRNVKWSIIVNEKIEVDE